MTAELAAALWARAGSQGAACPIGSSCSTSSRSLGYLRARAGEHGATCVGASGQSRQAGSCPLGCNVPELVLKNLAAEVPAKIAEGTVLSALL